MNHPFQSTDPEVLVISMALVTHEENWISKFEPVRLMRLDQEALRMSPLPARTRGAVLLLNRGRILEPERDMSRHGVIRGRSDPVKARRYSLIAY